MHTFFYIHKQSGASLVEFSIIAIPVLSLLLGSIEATQWYFNRQAIGLALMESARSAITDNNNPQTIIDSFEYSLKPLYTSANKNNAANRLEDALQQRKNDNGLPPWQIKVLSPSRQAFADFQDNNIKNYNGLAAINNNYLELQNNNNNDLNQDIFQANTLSLSLTWQHKPYLPLIKPILKAMGDKNGDYKQKALYSGYIPIQREISMLMHSHPVQWPSHPSGKVIFDWDFNSSNCQDWLCNHSYSFNKLAVNSPGSGNNNTNNGEDNTNRLQDYIDNLSNNEQASMENNFSDLLSNDDYQQLCGVTLCCIDWE